MSKQPIGLTQLPALLLAISFLGETGDVWAIDAANVARPASYIFRKKGDTTSEDGSNGTSRQEPAQGAAAMFKPAAPATTEPPMAPVAPVAPAAQQRVQTKPGAVKMGASGKPFVPVAPNSNCTVSAAAGASLEEQLRACAGLATTKNKGLAGSATTAPTGTPQSSPPPRH